jgi:YbbR domain-containing protein
MSKFNFFTPGKNENWKVVLLSVLGATIFWFFNALNKDYSAKVNYPLEYTFENDSVVVMKPLAKAVRIDVAGGGWSLIRKTFWFNVDPINISLDNPTDIKYYTRSSLVPLISDQLDGLHLNFVITDTLFIDIEEKVVKQLKVQVDSLGISLKENYRITSPIRISPDSVYVTGPKSIMNKMNLYVWVDMNKNNLDDDFNDEVSLLLPAEGFVTPSPNEIKLQFTVEEFLFIDLPIKIDAINFPTDSSIYLLDSIMTVHYVVNETAEKSIDPTDFNVTVDYSFYNKADSTISPIVMYSPEAAIEVEIPEKIKVYHAIQ